MVARWWFAAALCFVPLLASGCGNRGIVAPRTMPVRGTVFYLGKPAEGVRVVFHPQFDIGPVKFQPSGLTDKAGRFTLSTAAANDGAPAGEYAVTFEKMIVVVDRKSGFLETEMDAWKGKYRDPQTSAHKVQIHDEIDLPPFRLE